MRKIRQEQGASLAEYALILSAILALAAVSVSALGQRTNANLEAASQAVTIAVDAEEWVDDFEEHNDDGDEEAALAEGQDDDRHREPHEREAEERDHHKRQESRREDAHDRHGGKRSKACKRGGKVCRLQWVFIHGKWVIDRDGTLYSRKKWAKAIAFVSEPDFDYTLDLKTDRPGLWHIWNVTRVVFRWKDEDNYYALVPKKDGVLELAKMQNGRWKPWLAWADIGVDPTRWQQYRVVTHGNNIQVYLNGTLVIQFYDPHPILGTGIGVTNDRSHGRIDNVRVKRLGRRRSTSMWVTSE